MAEEPTVLDFLKSLLKGKPLPIPDAEPPQQVGQLAEEARPAQEAEEGRDLPVEQLAPKAWSKAALPWRALLALGLALIAQISLEPPRPEERWSVGLFFYLLAIAWLVWANWKDDWKAPEPAESAAQHNEDFKVRAAALYLSLPLFLIAFLLLGGNRYNTLNVFAWLVTVAVVVWAFWQGAPSLKGGWQGLGERLRPPWRITFSAWDLLVLGALLTAIYFRISRLGEVPPEMNSDHAEKLLDVWDVLHGQYNIFFPRNTGREDFQMYLTAAIADWFGTGISFLSLKIGTVLCGLLTLPYIYLLGKEAGGRRAGLFALAFAGIAYWPNVISRVGLRFTLYPFFVAPTLYYLVRGLRRRQRNDFLLAGIFLGAGLHGYSPFRIVPVVVVIAVGLYLLHRQSQGARKQAIWWLAALAFVSLAVFLPLLRFWSEDPNAFMLRAWSRVGSVEQPLPGPALVIFLKNLWNALVMFAWDNGNVWVVSITDRPALDIVSGALFHLGVALLIVRYLRRRHWLDLFLLLSIPLLMLPSILSLAFPAENPILNRTAGALVPVFVIVGIALEGLFQGLQDKMGAAWGPRLAWVMVFALFLGAAQHNYDLVFRQYQRAYQLSAWNTSELGALIRQFGDLYGSTETAWVVAYPHWVDTRLVGMCAGEPTRDFAIWPEQIEGTLNDPRPKLFLIKPEDVTGLETLERLYPRGVLSTYDSPVDGKDFLIYLVPPEKP